MAGVVEEIYVTSRGSEPIKRVEEARRIWRSGGRPLQGGDRLLDRLRRRVRGDAHRG